mmetsp:Transcript_40994/g.65997  ORF Transcript_40994/g.65997 Transcript_40994/m.65997 type:complete len:302 (+) Transcript_40994:100-1005(+)
MVLAGNIALLFRSDEYLAPGAYEQRGGGRGTRITRSRVQQITQPCKCFHRSRKKNFWCTPSEEWELGVEGLKIVKRLVCVEVWAVKNFCSGVKDCACHSRVHSNTAITVGISCRRRDQHTTQCQMQGTTRSSREPFQPRPRHVSGQLFVNFVPFRQGAKGDNFTHGHIKRRVENFETDGLEAEFATHSENCVPHRVIARKYHAIASNNNSENVAVLQLLRAKEGDGVLAKLNGRAHEGNPTPYMRSLVAAPVVLHHDDGRVAPRQCQGACSPHGCKLGCAYLLVQPAGWSSKPWRVRDRPS